ncbi:hypothetical protein Gotur_028513 [Gossypium turneri]
MEQHKGSRLGKRRHPLVTPRAEAAPSPVSCVFGDHYKVPNAPFLAGTEKKDFEEEKKKKKERGRVNGLGYSLDERLMSYLELAEFGSAALIRTFDLRYNLISALVECWRLETHTFHLPCGECTVTLEDVALQLGLSINKSVVTGVSTIAELAALCYSLLGVLPNNVESKFTCLRFSWLKASFELLSINATEQEVMCATRAYIMHIIGGVLMPDANNNRGSAILAMLYHELCRTTKPDVVDIGRCLILLQS